MARGEGFSIGPPLGGREGRELVGRAMALRVRVTGEQAAATVAVSESQACRVAARSAYDAARTEIARAQLAIMPLDRFKDAFPRRFRVAALGRAGYETVGDVLDAADRLRHVRGADSMTVGRAVGAARQLQATLTEETTFRFSAEERTPAQTRLLGALRDYERAKADVPEPVPRLAELAADLRDALTAAPPVGEPRLRRTLRVLAAGPAGRARTRDALARLAQLMATPGTAAIDGEVTARARARSLARMHDGRGSGSGGSARADAGQLWADYLTRPAAYHCLLREAADLAPDAASIQRYPLDLSLVTARLRGHQVSGASFVLLQERAIIGDERRLGKTVIALAAMAHLGAGGATHFLVVCPANAVAHWTRETGRHTRLAAHRLHGPERFTAWQRWLAEGGVAVTSFGTLSSQPRLPPEVRLAMLTVDEAHYTKNPEADRTRAVLAWIAAAPPDGAVDQRTAGKQARGALRAHRPPMSGPRRAPHPGRLRAERCGTATGGRPGLPAPHRIRPGRRPTPAVRPADTPRGAPRDRLKTLSPLTPLPPLGRLPKATEL